MEERREGLGSLLGRMSGNWGQDVYTRAVGQVIAELDIHDDALWFTFATGMRMRLFDDGQSCCEARWMSCDDDLSAFVGATLTGISERELPPVGEVGDVHEQQCVIVETSAGSFTLVTHNEHNGYYGGFWVRVTEVHP